MPDPQPQGTASDLIRIRPTLIVGLGGTGGDVILRIRKRFYEKYGNLSEFPIVAYLWVDTDNTEKHILAREMQQYISLSDPEKRMVTIPDTTIVTEHLKEPKNAHIDRWWYPGLNALGQMNEGAGQIRPYSRLAFFHHFKDLQNIKQAVKDAGARIRDPFTMQKMMDSPVLKDLGLLAQVEFNQPTNVYIICSIAGGTGSGMFLDMAFMIKDHFKEGNVTTTGYLVLPDHFGNVTNDKMRANSYAALKELNYYKYGTPTFDVEWEPSFPAKLPIPPFDYCYVLDNQNAAGQVTGGADSQGLVFELLADNIFTDFAHGDFADQKRSARVNLRQFMSNTFDYEHPRFKQRFIQRYQSFGLSSIVVPHARIVTACAYKLAAAVVTQWGGLSASTYNPADIPRVVEERFLPQVGLSENDAQQKHDILFSLLDASGVGDAGNGKAQGLMQHLASWRQSTERDINQGMPQRQKQRLRDFIEHASTEVRDRMRAEDLATEPEKWGHYPRTVRANLDALFDKTQQKLKREAFALIDERHESIAYVNAVLNEAVEALKRTITTLEKKTSDAEAARQKRETEGGKRLADLGRVETRSNWDGRRGTIVEYLTMRYFDALIGDGNSPGALRCMLQKRVYQEGIGMCRRVMASILGEERPDGRRTGGLLSQLDQLRGDLDGMRKEFETGANYFSQKDAQTLSLVLYEGSDVENIYYPGYVKTKDDVQAVEAEALRELQRSVSGLAADLASGRREQWKRILVGQARKKFATLPLDFHVMKEFFRRFDDATLKSHLVQIINRSAYWVTPSGLFGTFQMPDSQVHKMIGLPAVGASMTPAEASEIEGWTQKLKDIILRDISPTMKFYAVPESGEIMFYQEAGGFPINYLARLSDLRKAYINAYTRGDPLHIDAHDKKFRDLAIYSPAERRALEEAYECFLFGSLFDELSYSAGEYTWMKKDGFRKRPYPLGDRHMLILKLATDNAVRKELSEILKQRRDDVLIKGEMEDLARYYTLLDAYKVDAWGDRWGKAQKLEELEFDAMMLVMAIEAEEKRVDETAPARKNPETLSQRATVLAENPEAFARRREDGRWAMPANLAASK